MGTLQEPKAGLRLVGTAMEILQPVTTRFNDIDDVERKKHIEARVDILLLDAQMKSIFSMLKADPQAGVTKQSCDWQRQIVFAAFVELRSIRICLDIANTNEAFEDWDSLAAKTSASEKRIDETSRVLFWCRFDQGCGALKATERGNTLVLSSMSVLWSVEVEERVWVACPRGRQVVQNLLQFFFP